MVFIENRKLLAISTVLVLLVFGNGFYLMLSNDPRYLDAVANNRSIDSYWWEIILGLLAMIGMFGTIYSSFRYAVANNKLRWFIPSLFCWPLVFVWAWRQPIE